MTGLNAVAPQCISFGGCFAAHRMPRERKYVETTTTHRAFGKILGLGVDKKTRFFMPFDGARQVVGLWIAKHIGYEEYATEARICHFGVGIV